MAGNIEVIWVSEKQKYFFGRDWTAQIRLIWLKKLDFRRNGFCATERDFLTPATAAKLEKRWLRYRAVIPSGPVT
jgi:hypothetical protein